MRGDFMRERTIEIKILKKQYCYKEQKGKTPEEKLCPFGFESYQDTCTNCRWYGEDILSSDITGTLTNTEQKKD